MREAMHALVGSLERDLGGLTIVFCADLQARAQLVEEIESLAPTAARTFRTREVREALAAPDRLALLVPEDEREVLIDLDGSREQALAPPRTQPIVLFLLRDGDGIVALANEAPSVRSWASGNEVDPERLAEIDVDAERAAFHARTGQSPETWLTAWRAGQIARGAAAFALAYRAALLERS